MGYNKKYVYAVGKLNRFTQENKIKWKKLQPPNSLTLGTDNVITDFYCANYEKKTIGIYKESNKTYLSDRRYDFIWDSRIALALFDKNWEETWRFPIVEGLTELLDSVKYQLSDIESFIDMILHQDKNITKVNNINTIA
jgi:hypothetical protein